jgi:tetratricopeptide (TPR) repeat protein
MSSSRAEDEALGLFRAGRLAEAEPAWRAILAREPRHALALHMLGFILATTGRRAEGLELLDRSIDADPRNAAFRDNRAQVLLQMGREGEAWADLERAAALQPDSAPIWLHSSQALRRLGRRDEALRAIARALEIDSRQPGARYHQGLMQLEGGDLAAAEASLRRVLQDEPRNAAAINNLGIVLRDTGRGDEALAAFQRAAALDPGNADALSNLGLALAEDGQVRDAIRLYKRALQVRPGFAAALLNWGNALRDEGELEDARQRYEEAFAADPSLVEALVNAASALLEAGRAQQAKALYLRAASHRPGNAEALAGLAQVELREGDYARAWDHYERRFDTRPPIARARSIALPRLEPGNLGQARRVAVWMEQGVGDQILFSTLLPELRARGIEALVEVDARLAGLYRRGLPEIEFATPGPFEAALAGCDFHIPIGSLPRLFRREGASFDAQPPFVLRADPARVAAYRRELGAGPVIAIAWRSLQRGSRRMLGERKSIALEHFAGLGAAGGVRLLDLQYGDVADERRAFEARHPGMLVRLDGLDPFSDLEGLAAALVACGRLVTSSNVTAHLAGALGVPTELLYLRGWAPFSYWVARPGGRSLWYPSVTVPATPWARWEEAFEAVATRGK